MANSLSQLLADDGLQSLKKTPVRGDSYPELLVELKRIEAHFGEPHALLVRCDVTFRGSMGRVLWIETLATYEEVMSQNIGAEFYAVRLRDLVAFYRSKNQGDSATR